MSDARVSRSRRALAVVDRRLIAGVLLGGGVAAAGLAQSESAPTGLCSLFPGLCTATTSSGPGPNVGLITQQAAVVASTLQAQQNDCAQGNDGTLGGAIRTAVDAHTRLASATPEVEQFFDLSGSCFSSISQIFDLSFAIPSLSQILSSAAAAVLQYAQRRVCTMVAQVTSSVTGPINNAIRDVNGSIGSINGLSSSGGSMTLLNANLGAGYSGGANGGTVTVGTNPFGEGQTTFTPSPTPTPTPTPAPGGGTGSGTTPVTGVAQQIATLIAQIAQQQVIVGQAQRALDQANQIYGQCSANGLCTQADLDRLVAAQQALITAQDELLQLQQQLNALQGSVTGQSGAMSGRATALQESPSRAMPRSRGAGGGAAADAGGSLSSWFNSLTR